MTSRVSSKNKGKQAKRKNIVKKKREEKKNGTTSKQKTAPQGVEPGLSCTCKQLLDHCTTVTHKT